MSVNNQALTEVSKMSATAANILAFVSERQRNTVYTAFSGLRADMKKKFGRPVDRKEFDAAFEALEKIGVGKVDISKRGVTLGFTWWTPIRVVATMIKNRDEIAKEEPKAAPATNGQRRKVTLVIIRRNGQPQTVEVNESALQAIAM